MSQWHSVKARVVLRALLHIGWHIKRSPSGSHKILSKEGWPNYIFSFHDGEEIGPRMPARIAKKTGLYPEDL